MAGPADRSLQMWESGCSWSVLMCTEDARKLPSTGYRNGCSLEGRNLRIDSRIPLQITWLPIQVKQWKVS